MKKKISFVIVATFLLITGIFSISRYGWKLYGFQYCSQPSVVYIQNITIDKNENYVEISGNTTESSPAFVGFTYKIYDKTLCIGMRYNLLFGFFNRDGGFRIRMPVSSNKFNRIVLKNKDSEKIIWESGGPRAD